MAWVTIVAMLALLEYFFFSIKVGQARGKYGVKAPATTGNEIFERYNRVHQNTMEQLVVFVPAMWLFATYVSANIAALLGLVFVVGRVLYMRGYVQDPSKRSLGFAVSAIPQLILLLGSVIGASLDWLR